MTKITITKTELTMLIEAINYVGQQIHDSEIPVFSGFDYLCDEQIDKALEATWSIEKQLKSIVGEDAIIIVED